MRTMRLRVALGLLCASTGALQGQAGGLDTYVQNDVCPFECCHYGPWISRDTFSVRATPSPTAPITALLRPGDSVVSETGDVHLAPTGLAVVLRELQPASGGWTDSLFRPNVGDTVSVLSYLGEGTWTVRHRGVEYWSYDFWEPNYLDALPPGHLIRAPVAQWWVKLRRGDSYLGWVVIPEGSSGFDGADSCG